MELVLSEAYIPIALQDKETRSEDSKTIFCMGADQISVYPMMRFSYTPVGAPKVHDEKAEKAHLRAIEDEEHKLGQTRTSVWTHNKRPDFRYTSITR